MSRSCGDPAAEELRQAAARLGVDRLQRAPVEHPRQRHLQRQRGELGDAVGVEVARADPADLAFDARAASAAPRSPPRRPAWASRTTAAPTSRTAARSRAPGSRTCAAGRSRGRGRTAPARSRRAARGCRRGRSGCASACSHCSKSALAKAITASSRSGSWVTSVLATANALPKSSACARSRWIGATDAARDTGAGAGGAAAAAPASRRRRGRRHGAAQSSTRPPCDGGTRRSAGRVRSSGAGWVGAL